jgi:seryl-tRNA(Sec) selenium transferase
LFGLWPWSNFAATRPTTNIYQQLGVRPVINCVGAWTVIGASRQWPELHAPVAEASNHFVFLEELQEKIGERLSKLIGSEAAMVTTGAAGAITLGTCASLTGADPEKIRRLPDLTGMKSEVLIHKRHRNNFDHAIRNTGVKLIEVESKDQLVSAINDRTAMLYYLAPQALRRIRSCRSKSVSQSARKPASRSWSTARSCCRPGTTSRSSHPWAWT